MRHNVIKHNSFITLLSETPEEKPKPTFYYPWAEVWGIKEAMNLTHQVADLYLLWDAKTKADDAGKANDKLNATYNKQLDMITDQFTKYIDMIIGGELRHHDRCHDADVVYSIDLYEWAEHRSINRYEAWIAWKDFRKEHPEALHWAKHAFIEGDWEGGYGGHSWARVADLLIHWLAEDYTKMMFVDTAIGIQHNGGAIFDKGWLFSNEQKENFTALAQHIQNGYTTQIRRFASPEIKKYVEGLNET